MKAKTRHWFIYQQPCFRFHIFAIHLIGVRIMPSCGARPLLSDSRSMLSIISIHAPREGRDEIAHAALGGPQLISIHAPREGRDLCLWRWTTGKNISIHAPREGRDLGGAQNASQPPQFQSTRPARGATVKQVSALEYDTISIHAPREGRDDSLHIHVFLRDSISIHAPREGRDLDIDFLFLKPYISIHAPREGRDFTGHTPRFVTIYFNPRAPRGARRWTCAIIRR